MNDGRAAFEAEEIRGLARQHGATRQYTKDGIGYWAFPPWICPHCGLAEPPLEGCPEPLARHGPID